MRGGMHDLLEAWRAIERHPFGILLPAAVRLALGVLAVLWFSRFYAPPWSSIADIHEIGSAPLLGWSA